MADGQLVQAWVESIVGLEGKRATGWVGSWAKRVSGLELLIKRILPSANTLYRCILFRVMHVKTLTPTAEKSLTCLKNLIENFRIFLKFTRQIHTPPCSPSNSNLGPISAVSDKSGSNENSRPDNKPISDPRPPIIATPLLSPNPIP